MRLVYSNKKEASTYYECFNLIACLNDVFTSLHEVRALLSNNISLLKLFENEIEG